MPGILATPLPVRLTAEVAPVVELLTMVNLPVRLPTVVGLKVTGMAKVCPGARTLGRVIAAMENPAPVAVSELIVREAPPEDVRVKVKGFEEPSVTLPKAREVLLREICGVEMVVDARISQALKLY
jgi:hypothetical protein